MNNTVRYGLNRIMAPGASLEEFFSLAKSLGVSDVEVRNDLGGDIFDGMAPEKVKALAEANDISIYTINALQQFNKAGDLADKVEELKGLLGEARDCGCQALVMCPVNDPEDPRTDEQSLADTAKALETYAPVFKEFGILGLVEPLGFSICSLRTKEKAVKAMEISGTFDTYKLVHDTFHHYLAGEENFYPQHTGLVHISGVEDKLPKEDINDGHRILIGSADIMANKEQIHTLKEKGYEGVFSFEPFGEAVQKLSADELKKGLKESFAFIAG